MKLGEIKCPISLRGSYAALRSTCFPACLYFFLGAAWATTTVYSGSFDGPVYSMTLDSFTPSVVAVPSGDTSFVAMRARDLQGVAASTGLDGSGVLTLSAFNLNTGISNTATLPFPDFIVGPAYDPLHDRFFIFMQATSVLTYYTIDTTTLALTAGGNVTGASFYQSASQWAFSTAQRVLCGAPYSSLQVTMFACIDVDHLNVTSASPFPNSFSESVYATLDFATGTPIAISTSLDPNQPCVDSAAGSFTFFAMDGHAKTKRFLASVVNPPAPICPFNTAWFVYNSTAYIFNLQQPRSGSGFALVDLKHGNVSYSTPVSAEFASNVESFTFAM